MAKQQGRSKRKASGGKYRSARKKKRHELGRDQIEVRIGARKLKVIRGRGGTVKQRALVVKEANVLDPKTKKSVKSEILGVKENPANPHYVRRNVITKGAVIETKAGFARVTSRPGQVGIVNAVLIENK